MIILPIVDRRPFCTMYRDTESEKRSKNAAKELKSAKRKMNALEKEVEEIKKMLSSK